MKKLILLIAVIFSVGSRTGSEITNAIKEFKVIPDVVARNFSEILKVTFDSGASVKMGNEISPSDARNQPTVEWNADTNSYYTIVCFDPDAPSADNPFLGNAITWMVGNIPGNDINSGDVLAEYIPVSPPRGTKLHRSIFLLFKQPRKLHFDEKPIDKYTIKGRTNYLLKEFSKKYGLGEAIAGNFYITKFDLYVLEVYKTLNCCHNYNKPEE